MRGRSNNSNNNNNSGNRKAPNPLQRSYESNGPDVKVRGTAQHVAEKYLQLARDAQSSGDPVAAENYFQHAEHYYRILLAAQEQMAQQFGHSFPPNRAFSDDPDEGEEEGEEESGGFQTGGQQQQPERQPFNGNNGGVNGHGGQRQEGEGGEGQPGGGQRFERPNRSQDRTFDRNQDRSQDRNNQDRNAPRRFDRNERPERGERRFERQDGQPSPYAPRPEGQPGAEQPDLAPAPVQAERRPERAERPEREPRPERQPRAERQPRREAVPAVEPEQETAAALPAFLTTPTRVPITVVSDEPEAAAPAPAPAAAPAPLAAEEASEAAPKRPRGRRRSPREVMDALGSDTDTAAE
ncbi:DUF4167 domain-containing protein [Bosea sp. (in: a-proteobacteria)]|uniref:DUF4167 domain-containing protein n=1 Tax=Bosea sp. (in: a-proteobacteria) TaxID=1871050 RepID=UPI002FC915A8